MFCHWTVSISSVCSKIALFGEMIYFKRKVLVKPLRLNHILFSTKLSKKGFRNDAGRIALWANQTDARRKLANQSLSWKYQFENTPKSFSRLGCYSFRIPWNNGFLHPYFLDFRSIKSGWKFRNSRFLTYLLVFSLIFRSNVFITVLMKILKPKS